MGAESKELGKKLDALTESIDLLTRVTAISIGRENFFKRMKRKEQQIEALAKIGLPRSVIALIVGTTPLTVSVTLSKMKPKKPERREKLILAEERVEQQ